MSFKRTIILIANTGMGNYVLKQFLQIPNIDVKLIITNRYKGSYPYYRIKELFRYSIDNNIKTLCNVDVNSNEIITQIRDLEPDYVVVASYNQIFKKDLLSVKTNFINFHPSLLPSYRGASPVHWVLLNNEKKTGVTAHFIDKGIDTGKIIDKSEIKITENDTINLLLKKIHYETGLLARRIFKDNSEIICNNENIIRQPYYKRVNGLEIINEDDDLKTKINKIRAFGFYPGITYNNKVIKIRTFTVKDMLIEVHDHKGNKEIIY